MIHPTRRQTSRWLAAAVATTSLLACAGPASAQDKVRIGYAISKTGPYAGGASITTLPNYQLWVKDVNAAGGIKIGDKRLPIEIVEYDDRSNSEEAVKAIERLATQDKVDFILSPWGTGLNLAVGPTLNRLGYPHLAVTSVTDRAPELAKRWPNASFWLGTSAQISNALVDVLGKLKSEGKIGGNIAMVERGRPVRHRAFDRRRPRSLQESRLHAGLRQDLSARHPGHAAHRQGCDGRQCRHLRRLQLSARHDRHHRRRQGAEASIRRCSTWASARHSRCSRRSSAPTPTA